MLLVEGNPTNSQSTLSEAASLLLPPAGPAEKAYLERRRILVRKLFILNWAFSPLEVATSVSHMLPVRPVNVCPASVYTKLHSALFD